MAINLFDPNFYRQANPDLAGFSNDAAFAHFINFGVNEGRRFSPFVDLNVYRAANPDLAAAGLTTNRQLHDHLALVGVAEGRAFSNVIDVNFYRAANPDLAAVGLNNEQLLDHFRTLGLNEGRAASPIFNPGLYLAANPDLAAAGFSLAQGLNHYVQFGMAEGRATAPGGGGGTPPPDPVIPEPEEPTPIVGDVEPNNTGRNAVDIDLLTGRQVVTIDNGFVGNADESDIYRFTIDPVSNFAVALSGLSQDADLELYFDRNNSGTIDSGERIVRSDNFRAADGEFIRRTLGTGTYFVGVFPDRGNDTRYTLQIGAETTGIIDRGGDSSRQATNLGNLTATQTLVDFVGNADPNDIYRFSLDTVRDFTLELNRLSQDADVELYFDGNNSGTIDSGERIVRSDNFRSADGESISRTLGTGTYFVSVIPDRGNDTLYSLSLSAV